MKNLKRKDVRRLQELKARYEQYLLAAEKVRKKATVFDGLFGLGNDLRNAP